MDTSVPFVAFRVYTDALEHQRLMRRVALVAELDRGHYNPDAAIWFAFPCGALMFPRAGNIPLVDAHCNCGAHWLVRYERAGANAAN